MPQNPSLNPSDRLLLTKLKRENTALKKQLTTRETELKKADKQLSAIQEERARSTEELALKEREIQSLKHQLEAVGTVSDNQREFEEKLREQQTSIQQLERQKSSLEEAFTAFRKERDMEIKRYQADQVKALAERTALDASLRDARKELDLSKSGLAAKTEAWQKERDTLKLAVKQCQTARQNDEQVIAAYKQKDQAFAVLHEKLRQSNPVFRDTPPEPTAVIKVFAALLSECRAKLDSVDELEDRLREEQLKTTEADKLDSRIGELIALNREINEELESREETMKSMERAVGEADLRIKKALQEADAKAETGLLALRRQIDGLKSENESLQSQIEHSGKIAFIPPERVSSMLDTFYGDLKSNMKGLDIRESEIRLKVGFGSVSDKHSGIVIPTAGNTSEIRDSLSEVVVRLGRKELPDKE